MKANRITARGWLVFSLIFTMVAPCSVWLLLKQPAEFISEATIELHTTVFPGESPVSGENVLRSIAQESEEEWYLARPARRVWKWRAPWTSLLAQVKEIRHPSGYHHLKVIHPDPVRASEIAKAIVMRAAEVSMEQWRQASRAYLAELSEGQRNSDPFATVVDVESGRPANSMPIALWILPRVPTAPTPRVPHLVLVPVVALSTAIAVWFAHISGRRWNARPDPQLS